jgi:Photoprotection regulator fluorescence recovery protein
MASTGGTVVDSMREWKWISTEKAAVRRAFDLSLNRELDAVCREAKEQTAQNTEVAELWELEGWLGLQRRRINHDFDSRRSVLPMVLANLLRSGRLTEDLLHRLAPEKLGTIRHLARYWSAP